MACGIRGAQQPERPRWMMHKLVSHAADDVWGFFDGGRLRT